MQNNLTTSPENSEKKRQKKNGDDVVKTKMGGAHKQNQKSRWRRISSK